jgi:hypothetical protein
MLGVRRAAAAAHRLDDRTAVDPKALIADAIDAARSGARVTPHDRRALRLRNGAPHAPLHRITTHTAQPMLAAAIDN